MFFKKLNDYRQVSALHHGYSSMSCPAAAQRNNQYTNIAKRLHSLLQLPFPHCKGHIDIDLRIH
jgi:hypothetical protein